MLDQLKQDVCRTNLDLVQEGLVIQTWGNASGIDRARGLVVIKPSGVSYRRMKPADMVVVSPMGFFHAAPRRSAARCSCGRPRWTRPQTAGWST